MPPNDRVRTIAERNLGRAVTTDVMRTTLATSRLAIGKTVDELMREAVTGQVDLAFVVRSIRRTAEWHVNGWKKFPRI